MTLCGQLNLHFAILYKNWEKILTLMNGNAKIFQYKNDDQIKTVFWFKESRNRWKPAAGTV
jgi:hypothetical protein